MTARSQFWSQLPPFVGVPAYDTDGEQNRRGWGLVSDLRSLWPLSESSVMDARAAGPLHAEVAPTIGYLRMITKH